MLPFLRALLLWSCCGWAVANASEQTKPQDVAADPSCKPFQGELEDIAQQEDSRIQTHFFSGLEGRRIGAIEFKTISVFDPENERDNSPLYLWLNKLHVNTRPSVVRAQLLFTEGEPLQRSLLEESERILRATPYLTKAYILPHTICDQRVDLLVVTQDAWTLEPRVSMSRKSSDTETGFAISDGNILGSGNAFTLGYADSDKRSLVSYELRNPHIFNSPISVRLFYADTTDGTNSIVRLEKPFHALATPWATGLYQEKLSLIEEMRYRDETINEYHHFIRRHEYYAGRATDINPRHTQRFIVGYSQEEDIFREEPGTQGELPSERIANYSWLEYQYLSNSFGVFKNVNQIQRAEDIPLGVVASVRMGYGLASWDNPSDVFRYKGDFLRVVDVNDLHLLGVGVHIDGRSYRAPGLQDSQVAGSYIAYNYFRDEKRRWYVRLSYSEGRDLPQYEELTVGDITGLRGYPSDFQRGTKRYVLTLERRYFSDWHLLNIMRVGVVAFYDMGKAWGLEQYPQSHTLSNVGFGLRFSSSRVKMGTVAHIDVGTPLTQKNGISEYQVTIGASNQF